MSASGTERTLGSRQKDTLFCWLFALANSIKSSMCTKVGQNNCFDQSRSEVDSFLDRRDLTRVIRREICFGLVPKTLQRKFLSGQKWVDCALMAVSSTRYLTV